MRGFLERVYALFADAFLKLHPFWKLVGYGRAEAPVKFVERRVKGFLFDCRMCGQCILSSTGMSCPMNCPKRLRNGPCGGVRSNGNCEVEPDMPCVWVQAWAGSRLMRGGDAILNAAEAGRPFAARDFRVAARDGAGSGSKEGADMNAGAAPTPAINSPSPSRGEGFSASLKSDAPAARRGAT